MRSNRGAGRLYAASALALVLLMILSPSFSLARTAPPPRPTGTNYTPLRGGIATPTTNVTELLQCLLGPDIVVENAVLSAAPDAAGTFVNALGVIGFDQGILLSSGDVRTLNGPNSGDATSTISATPGDPDLDGLIPGYTTFDAAILEFDFTCDSVQEVVFQYVFGSEEYNEYVDSPFNDVFGFFLNGVNIAVAPLGCSDAGSPVSINHLNCGNPYVGAGPNCDCFRSNDLDDGGGMIDTELDGLTQVFFATGTIQPGTNHIKIAIADAGDQVLDSDVMIRCQSFTCGGAPVTGACCLPLGECVTLTAPDCAANGGTYEGDYQPCVPNLCGSGFGACCFADQSCEVEDPDSCAGNGGSYEGDGIPCSPNPCGAATGACCYGDALCELTDPFHCLGQYMGDWTVCDPALCIDLTGACCADAAVCELQTLAHCGDVFLGVGTVCEPNPCEAIVGACCHDNGFCQITLEVDCGDTYMGDRTVCDPNPCIPSAGVESPEGAANGGLFLGTPSPTPAAGQVEITWSLPHAGPMSLTLWDAQGRRLSTLAQTEAGVGLTTRAFALVDESGRRLPSGVYWLRLEAGSDRAVQKLIVSN
ncbi:MAG: choice-of-anchor L domain-containing protein [Candidatus Eisenbacteria bacterium]|nr:choice-of-anchor L domain-containing protein [Candidatus Eisenbacteria bacterium]